MMRQRPLGQTGLMVSELCLGTMTWGKQNTEAEAHAQMDYALTQGVTFWDTAEMNAVPPSAETYGKTETYIGNWLAANPGKREQIVLASKAATTGRPWIRGGAKLTATTMVEAVEASLRRLQTDRIDLYQLHWPTRPYPHHQNHWRFAPATDRVAEVALMHSLLQAAADLMKAGKIRHFGLSNESAWGLSTYLQLAEQHGLPRIASVQNEYSLLYRLDDMYMEEICTLEQVGFLPYSALAMGILTGKYQHGAKPEGTRITIPGNGVQARLTPYSEAATAAYAALAQEHGLDLVQMALAFTLTRPFVTSTIIGATSMDQLKTDIAAADVVLSAEVLAGIEAIRRQWPMPY
jgi:aryl-alcohol dehydrogenase-like predicted oxidoreductase